jgi:hypothetical protein
MTDMTLAALHVHAVMRRHSFLMPYRVVLGRRVKGVKRIIAGKSAFLHHPRTAVWVYGTFFNAAIDTMHPSSNPGTEINEFVSVQRKHAALPLPCENLRLRPQALSSNRYLADIHPITQSFLFMADIATIALKINPSRE